MPIKALLLDLGPIYAADPKRNGLNDNLGLGYISAYGRSIGFEIETLNRGNTRFTLEEIVDYVIKRRHDVVGISLTQERTNVGLSFVKQLRERGCDAHLTLGGYLPTLAPQASLEAFPDVDSLVLYEGEYTFAELLGAIEKDKPLNLSGLMTRETLKQGTFQRRPPITDLDSLPWPDRPSLVPPSEVTWLYSSRGCSHNCSFCSIPIFYEGSGWRPRSTEEVVNELEYLTEKRGVREIQFCDDNFLCGAAGIKRARQIATEIIERGIDISFAMECRLDAVDRDLLKHLQRAGLTMVLVGIESLDKSTLKLFHKPIDPSLLNRALGILDSLGIEARQGFINFHPESTIASIKRNNAFLRSRLAAGKSKPFESFLSYSSGLQPNLGTSLLEKLRPLLVLASPLQFEMRFKHPEVAKLWKIRNRLRAMLATSAYKLRLTYLSSLYSPKHVQQCEVLIDETHDLGCEFMELFTASLDPETSLSEEEGTRQTEVLLKRIGAVNERIEGYIEEFTDACIYRFHSFTEKGKHFIYTPKKVKPQEISKEAFDMIHSWRFMWLREEMRKQGGESLEQAFTECQHLLGEASAWNLRDLEGPKTFFNPFFVLSALSILEEVDESIE